MNINEVVAQLEAERDRLTSALEALQGSRYGKPKGKVSPNGRRHRKPMSKAARAKISRAQKARWKKQKAKAKT